MFGDFLITAPLFIAGAILVVGGLVYFLPTVAAEYVVLIKQSIAFLLITMPYWLPVFGVLFFWRTWVVYVRARYLANLKHILMEIKLPQEVVKSPLAMETFMMALQQTGGETTFIDRWWKGQVRATFSLEIISIEGQIKFIIYTQEKYRNLITAALYAQYPDIEIHEIPDYTKSFQYDPRENDLYIIDFKFASPNPYPIKTYVDYGIENEQVDEEQKVDPINHILEYMGSMGPNQQCWLQIIIRGHKKDRIKKGHLLEKTDGWMDDAKQEIEKIRASSIQKTDSDLKVKFPNPTKGEQNRIAALERSISKIPFDAGVRAVYMGKNGFFNGTNISGLRTLLRTYSAPDLNGFKPTDWLDGFDYPWEDFMGIRKRRKKRLGLEAYKRRSYFYRPFLGKQVLVLNTEELASIFHLPGKVARTPTLNRLPSKRSEAPGNLPV
jgi:hypothetical protein